MSRKVSLRQRSLITHEVIAQRAGHQGRQSARQAWLQDDRDLISTMRPLATVPQRAQPGRSRSGAADLAAAPRGQDHVVPCRDHLLVRHDILSRAAAHCAAGRTHPRRPDSITPRPSRCRDHRVVPFLIDPRPGRSFRPRCDVRHPRLERTRHASALSPAPISAPTVSVMAKIPAMSR